MSPSPRRLERQARRAAGQTQATRGAMSTVLDLDRRSRETFAQQIAERFAQLAAGARLPAAAGRVLDETIAQLQDEHAHAQDIARREIGARA